MPMQTFIFSHSPAVGWRLICMLGCALDVAGCAAQPLRAANEADALRVATAEYERLLQQHTALLHQFRRRSCGFLDAYVLFIALDSVYQVAGTLVTALQVSFGPGVFMDPCTDDAYGMGCMLYNSSAAAGAAPTIHLTLATFLSNLLPTLDRAAMLAAILLLVSRHSDRSSGLAASLVRQLTATTGYYDPRPPTTSGSRRGTWRSGSSWCRSSPSALASGRPRAWWRGCSRRCLGRSW